MSSEYNWSWKDYEREKRKWEKEQAAKQREAEFVEAHFEPEPEPEQAKDEIELQVVTELSQDELDALSGDLPDPMADPTLHEFQPDEMGVTAKDLVELEQDRADDRKIDRICIDECDDEQPEMVLCRCGARRDMGGAGMVPYWFGEKCIEADCDLRRRA